MFRREWIDNRDSKESVRSKSSIWSFSRQFRKEKREHEEKILPETKYATGTRGASKKGLFRKAEKIAESNFDLDESETKSAFFTGYVSPPACRIRLFEILIQQEEKFELDLKLLVESIEKSLKKYFECYVNLVELKVSSSVLIIVQATSDDSVAVLLRAFTLPLPEIQISDTTDLSLAPSVEQTTNLAASESENPADESGDTTEVNLPGKLVLKKLCRPYLKKILTDGSHEWEQLPKCYMFIATDTDDSRPRLSIVNDITGRALVSMGVSVSTVACPSEAKGALIQAFPNGSKELSTYLVRFKDTSTRDEFISCIVNRAQKCAVALAERYKDQLILQPHPKSESLPALISLTCPNLSLSVILKGSSKNAPIDFGCVRIAVFGKSINSDSTPQKQTGHYWIQLTSSVGDGESIFFLKSGILDSNFSLEVKGLPSQGRSAAPAAENSSASVNETYTSLEQSMLLAKGMTPPHTNFPAVTFVFGDTSQCRKYRLSFNAHRNHEEDSSINKLVEILNQKFVPFAEPVKPVPNQKSVDREQQQPFKHIKFAGSEQTIENQQRPTSPTQSPVKKYSLKGRTTRNNNVEQPPSGGTNTRGVTGWVSERVAYFNDLARRTGNATNGGRTTTQPVAPPKNKAVLERWKNAVEETKAKDSLALQSSMAKRSPSRAFKRVRKEGVLDEPKSINFAPITEAKSDLEPKPRSPKSAATTQNIITQKENDIANKNEEITNTPAEFVREQDRVGSPEPIPEDALPAFPKSATYQCLEQSLLEPPTIDPTLPTEEIATAAEPSPPRPICPSQFPLLAPWRQVATVLGPTMTLESYETIVRIVLDYKPFTPGQDVEAYLAQRWYGGENETRPKLEPGWEFPKGVREGWAELPYVMQDILVNSGYQDTVKAKIAQTWFRIDRANLEKVKPDYMSFKPKHLRKEERA
ncbi:hypothetical protein HDU97_004021 [Phlyctochytrium planicorne]|nr:hypothetical protein HDU97_004021 [Phlyctochytrium planicorne]